MQADDEVIEYLPPAQRVHEVDEVIEYLPAAHAPVEALRPAVAQYAPAAHAVQATNDADDANVPA